MDFNTAFDRLIGNEGGYVNDPNDPGGETNWGITADVARANGYTGAMRDMPRDVARTIYQALYWTAAKCDQLPPAVAFQVFDAAVNHGVGQAVKFLQRAVGVAPDGVIGAQTLAAARNAAPAALVMRFNAEREEFYTGLRTWPDFGKGWSRRVAANLRYGAQDV